MSEPGWERLGRTVVHRGRTTLVDHEVRLPDGSRLHYEVDETVPFSVASLILDGSDVLLSRQYRYPLDRWILDLPGGAPEGDESPVEAARRELEEELGLVAPDLRPLTTFSMNPGRSAWFTHLFISTGGVQAGSADPTDPAEQVRLTRMPLATLDGMIRDGAIVDAPLLVARAAAAVRGELPGLGCTGQS